MPTEPQPLTVAQAVHRAVETCGEGESLDLFLARFEDADTPISAVPNIEQIVAEAIGAIAADDPEPELQMAGAIVVYLAFRRDEADEDPDELLRLAARAEFDGRPPAAVADWLAQQGIQA